jgi:hypothetical protein
MTDTQTSLADLFRANDLNYYRDLTRDMLLYVELTRDECAAVLKAYDRGLGFLNTEEADLINAIIAKLKDSIHP